MRRAPAVLLAGAVATFTSIVLSCSRPPAALVASASAATANASSTAAATPSTARAPTPTSRDERGQASASAKRDASVLDLPRPAEPEWFGVYLMGKKAGYSRAWVGVETREGRQVLVARSESTISATVGNRTVSRSQVDEKVYEPRPGGRLLHEGHDQRQDHPPGRQAQGRPPWPRGWGEAGRR